jgi:ferredoxin
MSSIPVIEIDDCVGCGICAEICPEVFVLNESLGKAQIINPDGCSREEIDQAMAVCPVHCIYWEE